MFCKGFYSDFSNLKKCQLQGVFVGLCPQDLQVIFAPLTFTLVLAMLIMSILIIFKIYGKY